MTGRLGRYAVLGVVTNGLVFLVFLALVHVGVSPVAANAICYGLGLVLSYLGNRRWTFRSTRGHGADAWRFGAAHLCGFATSIATIALAVRFVPPALAQIAAIGAAAAVIFAVLNLLRFGGRGAE